MSFKVISILLCSVVGVAYCGDWINCNDDLPLKMFFSYPEPLVIHSGQPVVYQSDASIKVDMPENMITEYKVQKQIFGVWITVFSASDVSTCQTMKSWGFDGSCPLKKGEFKNTNLKFDLPKFRFAKYLVDGNYRIHVEGYNEDKSTQLFCGDIKQSVVQAESTPVHNVQIDLEKDEM